MLNHHLDKKVRVNLPVVGIVRHERHFSVRQLLIFVVLFGLIGSYFVWQSLAATQTVATQEAEQMTLPAAALIYSDVNASNGKAVELTGNGNSTGSLTIPSGATANSITIRAHGNSCHGWGTMSLSVDNATVMPSTSVSSSGWTNYSVPANIISGPHSLKLSAGNLGKQGQCYRKLYLDVVTFYGNSATPAPTLAFSASPTSVSAGSSSTLTWTTTNSTSCSASGAWSGSEPTSGSKSTGAVNATSTYNLACTGSGGSTSASVTVTVNSTTPTTSIYWGAWMQGSDTYAYYYGNPAPNGQNWADAPWGNTGNTWDRFESNAGKKVSIVHYGQPNPWLQTTFYGSTADIITNRGAIPLVDMKSNDTSLADITNGVYDNQIKTWANNVKAWGKPFLFRWDWEMNGTWFGYGAQAQSNPAAFKTMWQHFHDVVVGQGATNVTWVWCPNIEFSGSTPYSSLYPGDSYVDWTCLDGYNKNVSSTSFSSLYQQSYKDILALAPNKPMMIGEIGSEEYASGVKAAWITDMFNQLPTNYPKIKALVWFNWRIYETNNGVSSYQSWPIESSSSAQSAFRNGIASSYYASNKYGGLPLLTKVQPPQ